MHSVESLSDSCKVLIVMDPLFLFFFATVTCIQAIPNAILESIVYDIRAETGHSCANLFTSNSSKNNYSSCLEPMIHMQLPVVLPDMILAQKICMLFVIVVNEVEELDGIFYYESFFQFKLDVHYVIILDNTEVNIYDLMQWRQVLKDSHLVATLKPIFGPSSVKYAAYRSTFQDGNPVEIFDIVDEGGFHGIIFNNKLLDFNGKRTTVYSVKHEPNVVVHTDEDGKEHFSGFEVDMIRLLANALNSKLLLLAAKQPYYFFSLIPNVTGNNTT